MGRVDLVATADPGGPPEGRPVPWYPSLTELLARHEVDIVSIATPIGTHDALACEAITAGADVMLEKPPVASIADFWRLCDRVETSGRAVQVGFQSLGSAAIGRMRELATQIGELTSVQVRGMWLRDTAYYRRCDWAGRRIWNGQRVADGVCTNPLAHGFATAFAIVGLTAVDQIESIETELYHAHPIEADDTSWVRVNRRGEIPIDASLTLCGPRQEPPTVTLVGTVGRAEISYTTDELRLTRDGQTTRQTCERTDLLENLLDFREGRADLMVPLAETAGFMGVLEATQTAPYPRQIGEQWVSWEGPETWRHPVVAEIESWQRRCLDSGRGYLEAGAPWAQPQARSVWRPSDPQPATT
mgnify:FL=1